MELRSKIEAAKRDRDALQAQFDQIMKQPFFQKESDQEHTAKLEALQGTIEKQERAIEAAQRAVSSGIKEAAAIEAETNKLAKEKETYQDELTKIRVHIDPKSLTLSDVMKKLRQEDECRFREVLSDLDYEGKDPQWYKPILMDFIQDGEGKQDPNNVKALTVQQEKLMAEKAALATELSKTQNLLKVQVDIDKKNNEMQAAELKLLQSSVKHLNGQAGELTTLIKKRNDHLLTLQQSSAPKGLTAKDLERFNLEIQRNKAEQRHLEGRDGDAMTEFSVMTGESEIKPEENILDLRVSTASIDRILFSTVTNGNEIMPADVQTFLAVDFYNHETQSTDTAEGFEPIYNTLFSFKNTSDDFYIKYLEKDHILVDVFYAPKSTAGAPAQAKPVRLGSAKLPLNRLLNKDFSF